MLRPKFNRSAACIGIPGHAVRRFIQRVQGEGVEINKHVLAEAEAIIRMNMRPAGFYLPEHMKSHKEQHLFVIDVPVPEHATFTRIYGFVQPDTDWRSDSSWFMATIMTDAEWTTNVKKAYKMYEKGGDSGKK